VDRLNCRTVADWLAFCAENTEWHAGEEPVVMISYAREDAGHLQKLRKHLDIALRRVPAEGAEQGHFTAWDYALHAHGTSLGGHFPSEIAERMWRSRAAIVIFSPDYVASAYCIDIELPFLLWRMVNQGTRLFILRLNKTVIDDDAFMIPTLGGGLREIYLREIVDDRNPSLSERHDFSNEMMLKALDREYPERAEERLATYVRSMCDLLRAEELARRRKAAKPTVAEIVPPPVETKPPEQSVPAQPPVTPPVATISPAAPVADLTPPIARGVVSRPTPEAPRVPESASVPTRPFVVSADHPFRAIGDAQPKNGMAIETGRSPVITRPNDSAPIPALVTASSTHPGRYALFLRENAFELIVVALLLAGLLGIVRYATVEIGKVMPRTPSAADIAPASPVTPSAPNRPMPASSPANAILPTLTPSSRGIGYFETTSAVKFAKFTTIEPATSNASNVLKVPVVWEFIDYGRWSTSKIRKMGIRLEAGNFETMARLEIMSYADQPISQIFSISLNIREFSEGAVASVSLLRVVSNGKAIELASNTVVGRSAYGLFDITLTGGDDEKRRTASKIIEADLIEMDITFKSSTKSVLSIPLPEKNLIKSFLAPPGFS
jgi:hypothetical protein